MRLEAPQHVHGHSGPLGNILGSKWRSRLAQCHEHHSENNFFHELHLKVLPEGQSTEWLELFFAPSVPLLIFTLHLIRTQGPAFGLN
jgi:hypothetical protein